MTERKIFGSKQYLKSSLSRNDINDDPFKQFDLWYKQVLDTDIEFPNAMMLSTCSAEGYPSSRIVLMKGFDRKGFSFYTNSESEKGREINKNPKGSLCFWWSDFERQVRVDGEIQLLPDYIIDEYFNSRPRGSKIAASISKQSEIVKSREFLEKLYEDFDIKHKNKEIKRPEFWKGYILKPRNFEFWQGRDNRLHDRFKYTLLSSNVWEINRLYP